MPGPLDGGWSGFAKHFSASPNYVPDVAARQMVSIKKKRNDYAHEGSQAISFDDYLRETLAVVCHIAFLTTDEDRLSVYPWEDYLDTFDPRTKG